MSSLNSVFNTSSETILARKSSRSFSGHSKKLQIPRTSLWTPRATSKLTIFNIPASQLELDKSLAPIFETDEDNKFELHSADVVSELETLSQISVDHELSSDFKEKMLTDEDLFLDILSQNALTDQDWEISEAKAKNLMLDRNVEEILAGAPKESDWKRSIFKAKLKLMKKKQFQRLQQKSQNFSAEQNFDLEEGLDKVLVTF